MKIKYFQVYFVSIILQIKLILIECFTALMAATAQRNHCNKKTTAMVVSGCQKRYFTKRKNVSPLQHFNMKIN